MNIPSRHLLSALVALTLFAAEKAQAALVTVGSSAPAASFASSTVSAGGLQWRNDTINLRRDVGQSFLASSNVTLDAITFQLASNATPGSGALNAAFSLSLYQVTSASAFPASPAILTESGSLTGLTGTTTDFSKYVTFDLANTALIAGNYYAVVLTFPSQVANQNVVWQVSNTAASYTSGQAIISTDGTTFSANNDLVFFATAAVPEPAAASLWLAAAGVFAWKSRLRSVRAL